MRKLVLIAAVVLASASAQAGESRSLSAYSANNDTTATVGSQPVVHKSLRADNDTPATPPVETPRYSPPPADATRNPAPEPAEAPRYTARPAPVDNTPPAKTTTTTTQTPSGDDSSRDAHGRHARADRSHGHGRWTAGRIIATLHRYGIYW
jgi:hypothetical protein